MKYFKPSLNSNYLQSGGSKETVRIGLTDQGDKDCKDNKTAFKLMNGMLPRSQKILMEQVHGSAIKKIDIKKEVSSQFCCPKADGVYIKNTLKNRGLILGVRLADCMAVFVLKNGQLKGAFHAGWRGVVKNIAGKFSNIFTPSDRNLLEFFVSPHICENCFVVSKEIYQQFPDQAGCGMISKDKGKISLYKGLRQQLICTGVKKENINFMINDNYCTLENSKFHSHRRGDRERMLAFAIQP